MAMPMMRMVGTMAPTPIGAGNDISAPNTHPPPRGMTLPATLPIGSLAAESSTPPVAYVPV